jgi:hypothetical protein
MTVNTANIIIFAEIAERKVELGSMAIPIDDRLDEHIYQGMQSAGKALHQVLLQEVDDGIQEVVPV